nr:PHD finger protein EHD3 isoform X1 [Ipomoea batatas]
MVGKEKESNGYGGNSCLSLVVENTQAMKCSNGFGIEIANGRGKSAESSRNCLRTYKRRKHFKSEGKDSEDSTGQITSKSVDRIFFRNSYMQTSVAHAESNGRLNGSSYFSINKWRNVALEQIYQSLESDSGLKECIGEALASHPETYCATAVKESGNCCKTVRKFTYPSNSMPSDIQDEAKGNLEIVPTGLVNEPNHCTATQVCRRIFSDIVLSEEFSQLCSVLFENFEGMKVDQFLNISTMHSKMKEGLYEDSPMSFHSDIQEMWTKLHKFGSEILAISKCLSEKSMSYFQTQVAGMAHNISEDDKNNFVTQENDTRHMHSRAERPKACTCKHCGEKADGIDSLVCDSCEEMYHVSCIQPAVKEIPPRSWYCANCTAKGIESPHDNCVVCERLNAPRAPMDVHDDELMKLEKLIELEESSNGLADDEVQLFDEEPVCNVCKTEVKSGEKFQICGHNFCLHKFYHERCLSRKELNSYCPRWYCPSCLCRICLTDRDDTQIVLCDGCDRAYHIYCLQPPRTSIPKGKWFCGKCEAGIKRIRKVKRSYEKFENKLRQRAEMCTGGVDEQKSKDEDALDKSGGVDMLLNAAKTLNYEENLAVMGENVDRTIVLDTRT